MESANAAAFSNGLRKNTWPPPPVWNGRATAPSSSPRSRMPGYCAVKTGCDFLKLDQVIEKAVSELIDVDERNRWSALGTRKVSESAPVPLDEPRHEGVVRLAAITLPPRHVDRFHRAARCLRCRNPSLCHGFV